MLGAVIGKIVEMLPYSYRATFYNFKILSKDYGHFKSAANWQSIDKDANPIPWYSYPAIEFIKQLDLSNKTVFEYGSGNSTLFWASRCMRVVAVEDDPKWFDTIKSKLPPNVEYLMAADKETYLNAIGNYADPFDIIIIDGSHRLECTQAALNRLSPTGFFILDNSDWHPISSKHLRELDRIEIDFSGFNPINGYTTTTSLYLSRQVDFKPAHDRQPIAGIGGANNNFG
ncbi:class I SAM-dependent methyltransferase [Larkinella rosea]|uniref:Class I SAM-dependent methyltransferase n=1 Tax=Larkinella rosea TaxID=2025312 RepID=A0A3P1BLX8_9BACT|nr:class I SAM-dependent methyltransferase [Larkinella rosea]RRB02047.1 class I SAM-dependent methyltransferase [Larkinella rosea]